MKRSLAICAGLVLVPASLFGQGTRGSVTGTVKDSSGALVAGATITVVNEKTANKLEVTSQPNGMYLAPGLPPGDYHVSAELAGFRKTSVSGLKVDVGTTVTVDLTLEVGMVSEAVEVSANSSLIETASASVGATVRIQQVLELPLVDRNVFSLVNLVPASFSANGSTVSIGGGRTYSQSAMLDGISNSRGGLAVNNIEMSPPVDAMQEFKVEVNNLSAEYGHTAGGLLNAVTKSGTNEFHGSFYEFLRNDVLDASGWANDRKPPLRQNTFGVTIGGPIRRNKTFFFFTDEGLRIHRGSSVTRDVGLPDWRRGDFSRAMRDAGGRSEAVTIYDPDTGTGTFGSPRGTVPFPNNVIPSARLDPVAVKALTYIPEANRAPNNPFNLAGNWQLNRVDTTTRDYYLGKVDHEISGATRLFVRYLLPIPDDSVTAYMKGYGFADPDANESKARKQNLALNVTHLFSPTFFLNATAGFNRVRTLREAGGCCDTDFSTVLGVPNLPGDAFPRFNFGGGLAPVSTIGSPTSSLRRVAFTTTDAGAGFTKVTGSWTFKFGGQLTRYAANDLLRYSPSGIFGFSNQYTRGIRADGTAIANTGVNLADFLLGRINSLSLYAAPTIGKRLQYYGGYFQSDWKVSPNLTLNFGMRYDTDTPAYEVANRMANLDAYAVNPLAGTGDIPAGALGAMRFAGRNGVGKYLWAWDRNNFGPRFGFAWRLPWHGNTVVRGGYGVYYGGAYDSAITANLTYGYDQDYSAGSPVPFRLRDGVPPNILTPIPDQYLVPAFGTRGTRYETSSLQAMPQERVTPYSQNLNLTVQTQWRGTLFEAAYLGNLSRHINGGGVNLNQMPEAMLSRTEIPERLRRPYTAYVGDRAGINSFMPTDGMSNYHAFTLRSERRVQNGFGWSLAYTYSKWIDDTPVWSSTALGDSDAIQNVYNRRAERSLSGHHMPHRLVASPIFDLPFGKGRRWLNRGGVANAVLGGWQLAAIASLRSGMPWGITVLNGGRDILGDQTVTLRPDFVSKPNQSTQGQPASGVRGLQWFDPAAFPAPARFTFGNASRTIPGILGPGSVNFDTMLAKNFRVGERWRAQFRWELFDTFNTPTFNLPNSSLGGGSFGIVTGASGRRIMQVAVKLYW